MKKARRRIAIDEYRVIRDVLDGKYAANESVPESAVETMRLLGENFIEYIRDDVERIQDTRKVQVAFEGIATQIQGPV